MVNLEWFGDQAIKVTFEDATGKVGQRLVFRNEEPTLDVVRAGRPWSFDGDGHLLRLASEAYRIWLAYLFDPYLAIHTSEELLKFDGRPLFPERRAYTVSYHLSDPEAALYKAVTTYVREEMNRVERRKSRQPKSAFWIGRRRPGPSPNCKWKSTRSSAWKPRPKPCGNPAWMPSGSSLTRFWITP